MVFKKLRMIAATALIAGLGLFITSQGAQAASCQFGIETEFTATADVWTSTACEGELSGNDDKDALNGFGPSGMFGISDWDIDSKYDADTTSYSPSGLLTVSSIVSGMLEGEWGVSSWTGVGAAVLVLKGGNGYAAYLLDISAGLSGEWSTQALTVGNKDNQPAISHISLYVSPGTTTTTVVPLPAAGLLLIGALGSLVALRRRRKTA